MKNRAVVFAGFSLLFFSAAFAYSGNEKEVGVRYSGTLTEMVVQNKLVLSIPQELKAEPAVNFDGSINYVLIKKDGAGWEAGFFVSKITDYSSSWDAVTKLNKEIYGKSFKAYTLAGITGHFIDKGMGLSIMAPIDDALYIAVNINGENYKKAMDDDLLLFVIQNLKLK